MTAGRRVWAAAVMFLALATVASAQNPVPNASSPAELKRAEGLLTRDCGRCHAVRLTGDSPRPDAPAFRSLGLRYPIESLEETLGEGIMSGHPDMPEFSYDADDVGAIIDYLTSIQKR